MEKAGVLAARCKQGDAVGEARRREARLAAWGAGARAVNGHAGGRLSFSKIADAVLPLQRRRVRCHRCGVPRMERGIGCDLPKSGASIRGWPWRYVRASTCRADHEGQELGSACCCVDAKLRVMSLSRRQRL
jgi:hypothetical protein